MPAKQIFKITFFLFLTSLGVIIAGVVFVFGDISLLLEKPDRLHASASTIINDQTVLPKKSSDLKLSELTVKKNEGVQKTAHFVAGEPIIIGCKGAFDFKEERSFEAIVKTPLEIFGKKEITGENGEFSFTGTFTPKESGLIPVACRAEKERLLRYILVVPKESDDVQ